MIVNDDDDQVWKVVAVKHVRKKTLRLEVHNNGVLFSTLQ